MWIKSNRTWVVKPLLLGWIYAGMGVNMGDLFDYSPLDMSAPDFWTIVGIIAFLIGVKMAADDSPACPSYSMDLLYFLIFDPFCDVGAVLPLNPV